MEYNVKSENAVAAIRISSIKTRSPSDSPEAQKEQIEQFAKTRNITIKKIFIFMESASKEVQPVQEAIDYCKILAMASNFSSLNQLTGLPGVVLTYTTT